MNMVRKATLVGSAALLVLAGTAFAQGAQATKKPHVVIVATGGTIAGSAESATAAGYSSGAVGVDILIASMGQFVRTFLPPGEVVDAYLARCGARPALARALAKERG